MKALIAVLLCLALASCAATPQLTVAATIGGAIGAISIVTLIILLLILGILAAVVMMALTPPRSHLEFVGMLSLAVSSSCFGGPLVIEYLQLGWLSMTSQLGICFITAAPAWLVARIVANQLARWRDAKNPLRTITRDVREARRG